jgi:3-oxoacyl-(acyl-carrier-protein) synthase
MRKRVFASGAGVISSIGAGLECFGAALFRGDPGIRPSQRFGGSAAEVLEADLLRLLPEKGVRTLDRTSRLLTVTVQMAFETAGLSPESAGETHRDLGLVCGTVLSSLHSVAGFDWSGLTEGPRLVNPMAFQNVVLNSPAGHAGIRYRLRGLNSTVCAGMASSLYALEQAAECLRLDRAEVLLAGGVEELCEESILGMRQIGLASPTERAHPFGPDRDGAVLGEGSALCVLETEGSALHRGVVPLFEICGFGAAYEPRGRRKQAAASAADAMRQALAEAGISAGEVACVIASANGSPETDEMEACALRTVFGCRLDQVPVCAPKAIYGETMGAGGALAVLSAGLALSRGLAPPNVDSGGAAGINLKSVAQPINGRNVLINAFGCDGNHASMVIGAWKN